LTQVALKNSEFEVTGFESGKSLMAQLEIKVPDIILLDIMLPEEDGLAKNFIFLICKVNLCSVNQNSMFILIKFDVFIYKNEMSATRSVSN